MNKALVILLTAAIAVSAASAAEAGFNLPTGVSISNVHNTGWDDEDIGEEQKAENCADDEDDEGRLRTAERQLPSPVEAAHKPGVADTGAPGSKQTAPTRSNSDSAGPNVEKTAPKNSECKKYFPSVGMSLSIPCE